MECEVVDEKKYRMDYEIYQLLEQSSVIYLTLRSEPKKEMFEFFNFFSKVILFLFFVKTHQNYIFFFRIWTLENQLFHQLSIWWISHNHTKSLWIIQARRMLKYFVNSKNLLLTFYLTGKNLIIEPAEISFKDPLPSCSSGRYYDPSMNMVHNAWKEHNIITIDEEEDF